MDAGTVRELRNGRFEIDCIDSNGERHRSGKYKTQEEATAALQRIGVTKATGGEFLRNAANTAFDKALDLVEPRNESEGLERASVDRSNHVVRKYLRPKWGSCKLDWFVKTRMQPVQEWFKELHLGPQSQAHVRSGMKIAFDEAIRIGMMAPPNPVIQFGLRVRRGEKNERKVLTLEDISALMRGTLRRAHGESELVYSSRCLEALLGLFTAERNGEICGLCWDCIDFESRKIWIRRTVRKGRKGGPNWVRVPSTKTGRSGFRSVPMNPIVFVALQVHRDRLRSLGYEVEGEAPVLVTKRAELGSRLIKSTIQGRQRGRRRPGNLAPACRSGLRRV